MDALLPYVPTIGYSGLAVLVVCWLVVSFAQPGRWRTVIEWVGAFGMYVALLSLFVHLLGRSLANDSWIGMIGFGFLVLMFSLGLVLSLVHVLASLRSPGKSVSSATN